MARKKKAEHKAQDKGRRLWSLIGMVTKLVSGIAAAKALDAAWRTATGHRPPSSAEHPSLPNREALVWAALSGMAAGVARAYATRRAADYWVRSTGRLPPGLSDQVYKTSRRGSGTRAQH
ncbi:MAG TPA: DUF4235 domain-containing protein [Nocardioidaceae bacterium]|nr:DUF4235 domain-containing protein [Nocardioidaceae bacterium]